LIGSCASVSGVPTGAAFCTVVGASHPPAANADGTAASAIAATGSAALVMRITASFPHPPSLAAALAGSGLSADTLTV
jgi:hypothetical protein